ncbi:MAG: dihydroorotate dehydrogenase 2 [Chloroflexi bacterium]|nr:dihydroorotate dehydrogenase 2 [Chloroflexota bacterium]
MDLYTRLARPTLFRVPADTAHRLALAALRWPRLWEVLGSGPDHDPRLGLELHGLRLANPIGLAPGFDKDCDVLASLQHLGFGYLAPGAILRDVRPGNPLPRMGRLPAQGALLNCMGLPSKGREHSIRNLRRLERRRVPIFAEVHGVTPEEILENVAAIQPYAEALEVGLECPNTRDTDRTKQVATAIELVHVLARARQRPTFVKVPYFFRSEQRDRLPDLLDACIEAGLEGVVASAARRQQTDQLSIGYGQITGKPIFQDTLALVGELAAHAAGRLTIVAAGGVSTGRDAYAMLRAGASLVEILTAFVYRGWAAPALINRELLGVLQAEGVESVQALVERRDRASTGRGPFTPLPT